MIRLPKTIVFQLLALPAQELGDLVLKYIRVDRFGEIPIATGGQRALVHVIRHIRRQRDNGNLGHQRFEPRRHFIAGKLREIQIHQDQVWAHFGGFIQSDETIGRFEELITTEKQSLHEPSGRRCVIDVEDFGLSFGVIHGQR